MKPNAHTIQQGRHVVISEDAESQIRYLETHFKRDRWEATIVLRDEEANKAPSLSEALQAKGYAPRISENEKGDTEIHFVHRGAHDGLMQSVKDAGLMSGALHYLKHTPTHLASLIDGAEKLTRYTTEDSARLMSGLYLLGDVIQMGNGLGGTPMPGEGKLQAFMRPENSLNSLAFAVSTAQSLLLIHYAKESHELLRDQLSDARDAAIMQGSDPLDLSTWSVQDSPLSNGAGPFARFDKWARENPIVLGSSAMITACAIFAAASGFQLSRANRTLNGIARYPLGIEKAKEMREGALWNFGFSGLSTLTWLYFMSDKQAYPEHDRWYEGTQVMNPAQLFRETRMNPNQTGSLLGALGSASGLKGAYESQNAVQGLGQCIYLLGDAMMFLTEKKEYGKENADNASEMAKAAAQFIARGPIVLGADACEEYVTKLVDYVIDKQQAASEASNESRGQVAPEESKKLLKSEIMSELGGCYHPLVTIAEKTMSFVDAYPKAQREMAKHGVVQGILAMPNVFITEEELNHALDYAASKNEAKKSSTAFSPSLENPTPPHETERLIHVIPGQCDPANALILKDAMSKALFKQQDVDSQELTPAPHIREVLPEGRMEQLQQLSQHA